LYKKSIENKDSDDVVKQIRQNMWMISGVDKARQILIYKSKKARYNLLFNTIKSCQYHKFPNVIIQLIIKYIYDWYIKSNIF
jgi:hypothetical protein